ncbi:metallophosphoesterase [Streptomyces sp. NBC_00454]|uniref:metallophosphoesterase n=1 Tax=Streptomyces sp. NBC_00454 TaxID=2975747 RepID=UPI00324E28A7
MSPRVREIQQIVATTDVHSALGQTDGMLSHLSGLRGHSLIADCGDFFEGTGYYQLGKGSLEREILTRLYDVLVPGNHGWPHYFEDDLHPITICANAVSEADGHPLFERVRIVRVQGRRVAVTAVIGPQAFNVIPADQRAGHHVTDPATALREVMLTHHHLVDAWIVLSHSGLDADMKLAAACPFIDVIFAGHCHTPTQAPSRIGDILVVKGRELGIGYAYAEPVAHGWAAAMADFPTTGPVPAALAPLAERIDSIGRQLAEDLGALAEPWTDGMLDRRNLLTHIVGRLHTGLGADAVIVNESALRATVLADRLTLEDLMAIEPFGNQLVHATVPEPFADNLQGLLEDLTHREGPMATAPTPLPDGARTVLTTNYLADTFLGGRTHQAGIRLTDAVLHTLTEETL